MQYNHRQMKDVFELLKAAKIPNDLPEYDAVEYVPVVVDFWNNQYKDTGYKFKVFVFGGVNEKPIFKYGNENFNVSISIFHKNNHFDGLRNVGGMFGFKHKYCFTCERKFRKSKEHDLRCKSLCRLCGRIGSERPCLATGNYLKKCDDCGKKYLNEDCFNHHKKSSNCRQTKICEKCGVIWSMKNYKREQQKKHVCGQKWCQICRQFHSVDRGCFIRPLEPKKSIPYRLVTFDFEATQNEKIRNTKWCQICRQFHSVDRGCFIRPLEPKKSIPYRLVTFDFEATQNEKIRNTIEERRLHKVNFIAATVTCTKCMEDGKIWRSPLKQNGKSCIICGNNRSITFSHRPYAQTRVDKQVVTQTPVREFIQWILFELNPQYSTMAFSHNGGRYDMVMVFREIYLKGVVPSMIRRGNKLYELKIPRNNKCNEVIFRDSYNLCPVALGKLIGAFGLQVTEKQFFPHLANISENYGRTLQQLPQKSDYLYEGMRPEKQNEFDKCYEDEKKSAVLFGRSIGRILHKRCADSHRSTDCF
uniref:DNA-directed DNA polymerase n=1 Tax=Meloidogyne enterolobii TaxID=390850 RepID=A0A6V7XI24_MELEN|nr:unnamed protein product [Meloidogyne enterolobii]